MEVDGIIVSLGHEGGSEARDRLNERLADAPSRRRPGGASPHLRTPASCHNGAHEP